MPNQILFPAGSPSGVPVAQPIYLVDIYGNPITSTNGIGVNVLNANPNGQSTMANSAPVAIASNQSGIGTIVLPSITDTWISQAIRNGQGYNYSTGQQTTAGAANSTEVSLFNPAASGKSLLVYSIRVFITIASFGQLRLITVDPALTAGTLQNMKPGGAGSVANFTWSVVAQSVIGAALDSLSSNGAPNIELLTNGAVWLLPSGAANGLAVFINATAVLTQQVTMRGIEF